MGWWLSRDEDPRYGEFTWIFKYNLYDLERISLMMLLGWLMIIIGAISMAVMFLF